MKAVGIVGASDSGKTMLVERLVPRLAERGRVGTVKSIHHDVELDEPGKDTYRHRVAGADRVVGVTPSLTASFVPAGKADGGDDDALARAVGEFQDGVDVVLVEGFASSPLPKIVVGDPAAVSVAGDVLATVPDPDDAGIDDLVERIEAVPDT